MIIILIVLFVFTVSGCSHLPNIEERSDYANVLAEKKGWQKQLITSSYFDLVTYRPQTNTNLYSDTLTIYIEGDGLAWITPTLPSRNPTPVNPIALKLALQDTYDKVVYLARPCQYLNLDKGECAAKYWKEARFSREVVESYDDAVSQLKKEYKVNSIRLIGFSGGGAIAALIASQREDVVSLITVAGTLDHASWTQWHKVSPLIDSLNPANFVTKLNDIKQFHFVGMQDEVMPLSIANSFKDKSDNEMTILKKKGFTHQCCWTEAWPKLREDIYLLERAALLENESKSNSL